MIGKGGAYIAEADAMAHVAGYCVVNDISERTFQMERGGQWTKGKSADTFGPLGPWLVTADDVPDPQNLSIWLEVDGRRYQDGSTKTMIFPVRIWFTTSASSCRSNQATLSRPGPRQGLAWDKSRLST